MLKPNGQGHTDKYCDWCGKYCGKGGVDSMIKEFCSERCKRAYDKAHNTVDGGYKPGSIVHKIYKAFKTIGNIIEKIIIAFLVIVLILAVLGYLLKITL